jgi:hypothetical protein
VNAVAIGVKGKSELLLALALAANVRLLNADASER